MKSKYTLLFHLLFISVALIAQQSQPVEIKKSTKIETIEGTKYYMHTVEAGQTVYSIAKAYELNPKDIIFENPEAIDGVSPKQLLKIPIKLWKSSTAVAPSKTTSTNTPSFINHTIEKQQTLYAISKLYNVSIADITAANPDLTSDLKLGQIIKIPQKGNAITVLETKPAEKETVKEIVSEEKISTNSGSEFSIALLLPFYTDDIDTAKFQKNISAAIPSKAYAAIEFYEGFLTSVDSMKNLGMNLQLHVYDAPNDSLQMIRILEKSELKKMNMIVGPFHNQPSVMVAEYCKRNHITHIIPFYQQSKILLGNKYAVKVCASSSTQVESVADFITAHYVKQNILVLHNGLLKEKSSVQVFRQKANAKLGADSIHEIIFKTAGVNGLKEKLSLTKDNIIFIPSNDQAFVTSLVNSLRGIDKTYKVILFGMESWSSFENLDINTIQNLELHIPSSMNVNYKDAATISFMKKYREKYKTDPSKYAFQGYDIGNYFLSNIKANGSDFTSKLNNNKQYGLQTNFDFYSTAVESGFENKSVFILEYKDFSLLPVK